MNKDIKPPLVKDIGLAIVREENDLGELVWNTYLLNVKTVGIEAAIVVSKGYGELDNKKKTTVMLRHFLDELAPNTYKKVEPIIEEVFGITNEYWLTFFEGGKMYDRRFVFVPETIREENFTDIPLMGCRGVLIL